MPTWDAWSLIKVVQWTRSWKFMFSPAAHCVWNRVFAVWDSWFLQKKLKLRKINYWTLLTQPISVGIRICTGLLLSPKFMLLPRNRPRRGKKGEDIKNWRFHFHIAVPRVAQSTWLNPSLHGSMCQGNLSKVITARIVTIVHLNNPKAICDILKGLHFV